MQIIIYTFNVTFFLWLFPVTLFPWLFLLWLYFLHLYSADSDLPLVEKRFILLSVRAPCFNHTTFSYPYLQCPHSVSKDVNTTAFWHKILLFAHGPTFLLFGQYVNSKRAKFTIKRICLLHTKPCQAHIVSLVLGDFTFLRVCIHRERTCWPVKTTRWKTTKHAKVDNSWAKKGVPRFSWAVSDTCDSKQAT